MTVSVRSEPVNHCKNRKCIMTFSNCLKTEVPQRNLGDCMIETKTNDCPSHDGNKILPYSIRLLSIRLLIVGERKSKSELF